MDITTGGMGISNENGPETVYNDSSGVIDFVADANVWGFNGNTESRVINAGHLEKTAGSGQSEVAVGVDNNGSISVDSGTLYLRRIVVGAGVLDVGGGATLELGGPVAADQTVKFKSGGGTLEIDHLSGFHGAVGAFGAGDTIDLRGLTFAGGETVGYSGSTTSGVLTVTSGTQTAKVALLGQYAAANFVTSSDGQGGTDITFAPTPGDVHVVVAPGH
jgi:hypothetical protein